MHQGIRIHAEDAPSNEGISTTTTKHGINIITITSHQVPPTTTAIIKIAMR